MSQRLLYPLYQAKDSQVEDGSDKVPRPLHPANPFPAIINCRGIVAQLQGSRLDLPGNSDNVPVTLAKIYCCDGSTDLSDKNVELAAPACYRACRDDRLGELGHIVSQGGDGTGM